MKRRWCDDDVDDEREQVTLIVIVFRTFDARATRLLTYSMSIYTDTQWYYINWPRQIHHNGRE